MERDVSVFPLTGRRAGEIGLFMLLPDDKWRRAIQSFLLFFFKVGYLVFQSLIWQQTLNVIALPY
jgi:hypothetical protein